MSSARGTAAPWQDAQATTCRYICDPRHVCMTSFGAPLQPGQTCFAEARAQLAQLIDSNVDRWLAEQDAMEADADARLTACEWWENEDWRDAA